MKTRQWNEHENRTLIRAYLHMLDMQNAGTKYSKAAIRRHLIATDLCARSHASIEFKLMNVSGCMTALGRMTVKGYAPAMNYQRDLMTAVCAALNITAAA